MCVCVALLHKDEWFLRTTGSGQPHRLHWSKWVEAGELDPESLSSSLVFLFCSRRKKNKSLVFTPQVAVKALRSLQFRWTYRAGKSCRSSKAMPPLRVYTQNVTYTCIILTPQTAALTHWWPVDSPNCRLDHISWPFLTLLWDAIISPV